jgi:hypothetical protein
MAGTGSTGARACVRPADRPQSGHDSPRTTRPAHARPGARAQTDATHDQSGRRRSAVRHSRSRSCLHYATASRPLSRGWEVRRPVAVRLALLTARTLVSAGLVTPAGRARCNQIGNAFPWRALQRLRTPGMRQTTSTRVDPPQFLVFQDVRVRRCHRDLEGLASAAVAGRRCAVILPNL